MNSALAAIGLCILASCQASPPTAVPHNVLVVVMDDVGCDAIATYGEHPGAAATPTLDRLAREGVLFRHAYAQPLCSPTRASLLTGRYAFRTGIGRVLGDKRVQWELQDDECTLPELLRAARPSMDCAAIGKWHLSSIGVDVLDAPRRHGFTTFAGIWENLDQGQSYYSYDQIENGVAHRSNTYLTTQQVDDALHAIGAAKQPWFVYLAFSAAHAPWQVPPEELSVPRDGSLRARYDAMVTALDRELGRLLASLDPAVRAATTVIVLGDNGTSSEVTGAVDPLDHGKGSLFEGGVRVPLIVAGAGVVHGGREVDALVHVVDVFPTVAELEGVDVARNVPAGRAIDGVSLVPLLGDTSSAPPHEFVVCEHFWPNGRGPYEFDERMIRDERFKLIVDRDGTEMLFDLRGRLVEDHDLLAGPLDADAREAHERLKRELTRLLSSQ